MRPAVVAVGSGRVVPAVVLVLVVLVTAQRTSSTGVEYQYVDSTICKYELDTQQSPWSIDCDMGGIGSVSLKCG